MEIIVVVEGADRRAATAVLCEAAVEMYQGGKDRGNSRSRQLCSRMSLHEAGQRGKRRFRAVAATRIPGRPPSSAGS
jgi:hypothetical protein